MDWVRPCATSGEKVTDSLCLPVKQIFEAPNSATMTIAATRMYRSLMNSQECLPGSWRTISKMGVRCGPISLSRIEFVHTEIDQSSKSQMVGSSPDIGTTSYEG